MQARTIGAVHLHTPAPDAPPAPRQLLPVPATWTDRRAALRDLDAMAANRPDHASALVVVSGPGGVGKTALANKWLAQHAADCTAGYLYAELTRRPAEGGDAVARQVLRHFLASLGHAPGTDDVDGLAAWWRSASYGLRLGILLDNAGAQDVLPLLPGGPGHLVAVTSREPLDPMAAHGAIPYPLGPLEPAVAERLVARIAGRERVRGQQAALGTITARCAYLPLALVVAATSVSARPAQRLSVLADALSYTHASTPHLEGNRAVTSVVEQAYDALTDATARRAYRLLSTVPLAEFDTDTTAHALDLPPKQADAVLHELAEARLLEPLGERPGRSSTVYRFHDTVRPHAQRRAQEEDANAAVERTVRGVAEWLLATFTRAEQLLTPHHRVLDRSLTRIITPVAFDQGDGDERRGARMWVEAHMRDLDLIVREAAHRQWHEMVWQLVHAAWPGFHILRLLELSYDLHKLGVKAAEECGNPTALREMLTTGALALRGLYRYEEAAQWAERARILARAGRDRRSEGQATHEKALCAKGQGDRATAVALLHEALEIRVELGDRRAVALTRIILGQIDLEDRRPTAAIDHAGAAHVELRSLGDLINAGRAVLVLAQAYARITPPSSRQVSDLLDLADADFHAPGSLSGTAQLLRLRGDLAEQENDIDAARSHYTAAHTIYQQISPHDADQLAKQLAALPGQRASPAS
ncbi:hypothetical protein [Streptomyces sp. NPDC059003]|uniref:hypothetical protein n=1 Tax=Streptomyces sp. NPDC059003 TaxID=3346691 RepID=UPI003697738E